MDKLDQQFYQDLINLRLFVTKLLGREMTDEEKEDLAELGNNCFENGYRYRIEAYEHPRLLAVN